MLATFQTEKNFLIFLNFEPEPEPRTEPEPEPNYFQGFSPWNILIEYDNFDEGVNTFYNFMFDCFIKFSGKSTFTNYQLY